MDDGQQGQQLPLPADFETWQDYWTAQDMPWRIEPEISDERQRYLTQRMAVEPDIEKGIYPFRDESGSIKLTRADVEWLLASHRSRGVHGPVDPTDDMQLRRDGLDLRGADLKGRNLSGLPLARLNGGLDIGDVPDSRKHDAFGSVRDEAAIHLEGADLSDIHLEAAFLPYAYLDGANRPTLMQATCTGAHLLQAHLERASVWMAHLEAANLGEAHLEGADLVGAHLQGAVLNGAHLERARLSKAHLEGADLRLAHLEGATLEDAHLGGETVSASEVERIRMWVRNFRSPQPAADLREAFFDATTILRFVHLGDAESGWVSLADTHYGGVNLGVVDWKLVGMLGDEWAVRKPKESLKFMQPSIRRYQLQQAVQANRQLAVALSSQGLNEDADRFAYRAQRLQRHLLRDVSLEP